MRLTLGALGLVAALAHTAAAEPITFAFTGRVTEVTGVPAIIDRFTELGVAAGAPLHGEYVFESSTPSSTGSYTGAILEARMQIGGWTLHGPLSDRFSNSIGVGPTSYTVTIGVEDAPDVIPGEFATTAIEIFLLEADPAFESTDLPVRPPDLSLFGIRFGRLLGGGGPAGRVFVHFDVESLTRISDRVEEILGIRVRRHDVVFQVTSSGCTHKGDFEVVVFEGAVLQVALIRTRPDPCRVVRPLGTRLRFSHGEMGIDPGEEFVVINPRAPVLVPERRRRPGPRQGRRGR